MSKKKAVNHEITISMTDVEWAELAYAMNSLMLRVKAGCYYSPLMTAARTKKWLKTLRSADSKLYRALKKDGVPV